MGYECVTALGKIKEYLTGAEVVAFDFETSPLEGYRAEERAALDAHKAEITGVSFSVSEGSGIYVPFRHRAGRNIRKPEAVMEYLQAALFLEMWRLSRLRTTFRLSPCSCMRWAWWCRLRSMIPSRRRSLP